MIIKHANRRLYDATERRVITLLELSDLVVEGGPVSVVDKASGEDITAVTLLQSLLERLKRRRTDATAALDAERIVAALRRVMTEEPGGGTAQQAARESVSG